MKLKYDRQQITVLTSYKNIKKAKIECCKIIKILIVRVLRPKTNPCDNKRELSKLWHLLHNVINILIKKKVNPLKQKY